MKQGEIWLVDFDPTVGAEIRKRRPAIVVSNNSIGLLRLKVIVPLTDWKDKYANASWMVLASPTIQNGLRKESAVDCLQIRSVSEERIAKKLGVIETEIFVQIQQALTVLFQR